MPPVKCSDKPGKIFRRPYDAVRSSTGEKYHVKAACVEDKGMPGKVPKKERIPIKSEKDFHLGDYGYETKYNAEVRQAALDKAIMGVSKSFAVTPREAAGKILRKINLLATLNKNTEPYRSEHKYKRDVEYLSKRIGSL